jgi:hypothetical protein
MAERYSRRWFVFWGSAAVGVTAAGAVLAPTIASTSLFDKPRDIFNPDAKYAKKTIAILFSGSTERLAEALRLYDGERLDALLIVGIKEKDKADAIRKARALNNTKDNACGDASVTQPPKTTRKDDALFSCYSVTTHTDAKVACEWFKNDTNGWLKQNMGDGIHAIIMSDDWHIERCMDDYYDHKHIIPGGVQNKIHLMSHAIIRTPPTLEQVTDERIKRGLGRLGIKKRPAFLRRVKLSTARKRKPLQQPITNPCPR